MRTKFEVIRDVDGNVDGYKLGKWYLMKHYYWANDYEWIINKDGRQHYFTNEFHQLIDNGEIELANSCAEGKQRLVALNA